MAELSHIWRRMAVALMALLLGVLTFGPALDAAVCEPETVSAILASDTAAASPVDGHGHDANVDAACLHGHCHHAAFDLPSLAGLSEESVSVIARHDALRLAAPTSDPTFGLKRPPRA
jgi:hypothetical protein